jgi:hypothetical protein
MLAWITTSIGPCCFKNFHSSNIYLDLAGSAHLHLQAVSLCKEEAREAVHVVPEVRHVSRNEPAAAAAAAAARQCMLKKRGV